MTSRQEQSEAGSKSRARLLIVDEDVEFADALLEEAAGRGMHGSVASSWPPDSVLA